MLEDGKTQFGRVRTAAGFSFVQVYQAGHMVPMDQPENALAMLSRFIKNDWSPLNESDMQIDDNRKDEIIKEMR